MRTGNEPCIHVNPNNDSQPLRTAMTKRSTWKALPFFNLHWNPFDSRNSSPALYSLICRRVNNGTGYVLVLKAFVMSRRCVFFVSHLTRNISKERENPRIPVLMICFNVTEWNRTKTNRFPRSTLKDWTSRSKDRTVKLNKWQRRTHDWFH